MRPLHVVGFPLVCGLMLLGVPHAGYAATFVVNATTDAVDAAPGDGVCDAGGGVCTLRAAIHEANAVASADAVTLPAGTYTLTIPGSSAGITAGDLDVTQPLTITGAGAGTTIVNANGIDRVFDLSRAATIAAMTIRGGATGACGGGIRNINALTLTDVVVTNNTAVTGGGLCNDAGSSGATTTLVDSSIESNAATQDGGGIWMRTSLDTLFPLFAGTATVTLTNSSVADNQAVNGGGIYGISQDGDVTVNATGSALRDNVATGNGGAVTLHIEPTAGNPFPVPRSATLHATDTTIRDNTAAFGGGIRGGLAVLDLVRSTVSGNVASVTGGGIMGGAGTITDSTISGNATNGSGGGIFPDKFNYTLKGVTITGNVADVDNDGSGDGGGISAPTRSSQGFEFPQVELSNTIVAGNHDLGGEGPDCSGELHSDGHNLLGNAAGCLVPTDATNLVGLAPNLGPLAANGGPTETHALLAGSPALDEGAGCNATDQRGVARPQGPACDIGAVEQIQLPTNCGNGSVDIGEICDDGNVRDGDCCSHLCQYESAGAACSDGNPCTDDVCDGSGGCGPTANGAPCTDGSVCTLGAETCAGGACVPGAAQTCSDDGNVCTNDACNPSFGCNHPPANGTPCDDGNACTDPDTCSGGSCHGTETNDPCDDGNTCTSPDVCQDGECHGGTINDPCDDGDACTVGDNCSTRTCEGEPVTCSGICESCDSAIGCTFAPRVDCHETDRPRNTSLQIKNKDNPKSDSLRWKWQADGGTQNDEVGYPFLYPDYELCVFDETAGNASLAFGARPGTNFDCGNKPCWTSTGSSNRYKDPSGSPDGLTQITLQARTTKTKLDVAAKGVNLTLPTLPFVMDPAVVVELRRRHGSCWTSRFSTPTTNTTDGFKSKAD